ncbi:MAG: membrane dipeptidase [SAR202 cluster bacterium]|jgi:membrane dipeptidase|nr:membrane dipeptidase [SAR202 cluster bacterium]
MTLTAKQATDVYHKAVVIDGLNVSNWDSPAVYKSLNAGHVTAINATIAVFENFTQEMDKIARWNQRLASDDSLIQIRSACDIQNAKTHNQTGVIFGWQNASPLGNNLDRLVLFHHLGVRIIQLTYNERNLLGNGCWERNDDGLSTFGVDAIREMNRLGILIDLSHVGDVTTIESIELSDQPVSCTHSNSRSFFDHPRNKTDEALRLISEKGGVIGATSWPPFLRNGFKSTLTDFGDAIDDMVERVGIDHVGIGSDYTQNQPKEWFDILMSFQGTKFNPRRLEYPETVTHTAGLETPDMLPNVAIELARRGYREEDILKVIGGNWLRLFNEVWRN